MVKKKKKTIFFYSNVYYRVLAFARLLASIYGLCMISILVNIQVNLISRYVHLDKLSEDNEDESDMVSFNYLFVYLFVCFKSNQNNLLLG